MTQFIASMKFVMEITVLTRRGSIYQGRESKLFSIVLKTS